MDISLNLKRKDTELMIATLAQAVREADAEADKYYDMNEQTKSHQHYQTALIAKAISRQDVEAIGSVMNTLKTELTELKAVPPEDDTEGDLSAFIDLVSTMQDYSTEHAKSMYMHDELQEILIMAKK